MRFIKHKSIGFAHRFHICSVSTSFHTIARPFLGCASNGVVVLCFPASIQIDTPKRVSKRSKKPSVNGFHCIFDSCLILTAIKYFRF